MRTPPRHMFVFTVASLDGETRLVAPAKVRHAKTAVELILTIKDVLRSLELGGQGNSQTCAMACCANRQRSVFSHPYTGYIDWTYDRAYVSSRADGISKMPNECVAYAHRDRIARLFDEPGGAIKVIEILKANGGSRKIRLYPIALRTPQKARKPAGQRTGERSPLARKGSALRQARVMLGGVAA